MADHELSYGEKAVGLSFNPSGDSDVDKIKRLYAEIIDRIDELRAAAQLHPGWEEKGRLASIAITEAQSAQMWAVKAISFRS